MTRATKSYRSRTPRGGSLAELLLTFPSRRPVIALAVAGVVLLVALAGVLRIRVNTSLQTMFPQGKPSAEAMIRVLEAFPASNELILVASLPGDPPARAAGEPPTTTPDPAAADRLTAFAARLERELATAPDAAGLTAGVIYRADPEFRRFGKEVVAPAGLSYLDDAAYAEAERRLTPDGIRRQIELNLSRFSQPGAGLALKEFLKDPLGLIEFVLGRLVPKRQFRTFEGGETFVSPDGRAILIRVVGTAAPSDLDYCERLVKAVTAAAERANVDPAAAGAPVTPGGAAPGKLTLHYTGAYAAADFSHQAIRADSIESIFLSVTLLQLLFLVVYRRPFRQFLLEITPVAVGVFVGFGVYGWFRGTVSPVAAVIGGILAGMGIDYSVLYLASYMRHLAAGASPAEAARLTAVRAVGPMFAAWFTSAVGFGAIAWSSVPTLRDFGVLGALGLAGVFVAVALVLPAVVVLWDDRRLARRDTPADRRLPFRWDVAPLLHGIQRRRRAFIGGSVAVFVVAAAYAGTRPGGVLPLESDLHVMHPQPNPALAAEREIAERFGSEPGALLVHLKAETPEKLVALAHEADRRLSRPDVRAAGVAGTLGLASLLPDPAVAARRQPLPQADVDRIAADFRAAMTDAGFAPPAYEPYADFLKLALTQRLRVGGGPPADTAQPPPGVEALRPFPALWRSLLPSTAAAGELPTEAITLVFVDRPTDQREPRERLVNTAHAALAGVDGATLTGLPVISLDTEQATRRDLPLLLGIAGGVVLVVLLAYYRSFWRTALALLPLVFSLTVLAAVARLTDTKLNLVNLVALPLLIGIDVDYGIYFVSLAGGRRTGRRRGAGTRGGRSGRDDAATVQPAGGTSLHGFQTFGSELPDADRRAGRTGRAGGPNEPEADGRGGAAPIATRIAASAQAVITCAAAAMLGFGSLATVSVPAVRSLGIVVAVGVAASLIGTFALRAPALMVREERLAPNGGVAEDLDPPGR
jgi:predicted RND superfamily exporter protein